MYKGEPFYLRSDVSELHTVEKWVPLGFEVLPTELGKPFKVCGPPPPLLCSLQGLPPSSLSATPPAYVGVIPQACANLEWLGGKGV